MMRYLIFVLPILYALAMWHFSSWRLRRELDAKSTELADPALKPVTDKLAKALDIPRVRVFVYEIPQINGLAAPDGRIFITRGFLQKFRSGEVSGEEIASVIAHEMGHVALGHSRRRMIDFSGQNALRMLLMGILGRFIPVIGPWLANTLLSLLAAKLSRRDEYEADAYATALLLKAGIGADPQISLFQKLERLSGGNANQIPAWLLSHPKADERIAAIRDNTAKWT
ncbi:MAG: peptidase M48 [Marivivens sp.]|uniref:M48 family metallopeptidase n=1 Tax=Marivivens sp. TaxID=1978374 RepID=UPI00183DDBDB|nr:M48 family metallopeptidase [Marivivens sp.]MCL7405657.1 M48 family metallopeptidase [Marivivens geojensis]NBQ49668.1 peptidase M48 [Marivivens sp.]NBX08581.1 peptidase M48 [Marivivens sp.]NDH02171.1 peptidase M48 [Marivivens sp.]NVJ94063.1 M48 family metalloprotease [Marivivens sp.]